MEKKNIKAWNRKTGSEYVFCEKTPYGDFYLVSTSKNTPPWLVSADSISFTDPETGESTLSASRE